MSPGDSFMVTSENGWAGSMSADVFGIVCCLYAFSPLAFSGNENLGELCAQHFQMLRVFTMDYPEVGTILAAID